MKPRIAFLFLLALPMTVQEYKIAVVSGLHAHAWGHLVTHGSANPVKL
jgi:hypothetical protein